MPDEILKAFLVYREAKKNREAFWDEWAKVWSTWQKLQFDEGEAERKYRSLIDRWDPETDKISDELQP